MFRIKITAAIAMAALAVLTVVAPATADDLIPLKGKLSGDVIVTPVVPPLIVDVDIDASGRANHLGRFTVQIPHRVDRSVGQASGRYIFTAANGDSLEAKFTGRSTLIAPGMLFIEEYAAIVGGTGRFANATGNFTCKRIFDVVVGTTVGEFEGTISPPGE